MTVQADLRFNSEGVSLSLYEDGHVVDEAWFTWSEVELLKKENETNGASAATLEL